MKIFLIIAGIAIVICFLMALFSIIMAVAIAMDGEDKDDPWESDI